MMNVSGKRKNICLFDSSKQTPEIMKKLAFLGICLFSAGTLLAQTPKGNTYTPQEYEQLKSTGTIPPGNHTILLPTPKGKDAIFDPSKIFHNDNDAPHQNRGGAVCGCYIEPDASYTTAMAPNDDGSTGLINIPFTFCLYGDNYTSLYINNNGNVSFGTPYGTFSANPFPDPTYVMVAPFWADVDTRGGNGSVVYKIYPNAIYINWVNVGYYSQHGDKRCTFQLVLSDGTDPFIGMGNNVAFCYQDMDWTTGDASGGTNGFGGTPATVGSNRGNGVDFVQFGRFDQAGNAYDGPFGLSDGVDWLDNGTFKFNTCVSSSNIAPIVSGVTPSSSSGSGSGIACGDTINICGVGDTLLFSVSFIAPENGQTISFTVNSATLTNYSVLSTANGTCNLMVVSSLADAGFNILEVTATDNGTPAMSTMFPITVFIDTTGLANFNPVILGAQSVCVGGSSNLTVSGGPYDSYLWNTTDASSGITVNTAGQYYVTVGQNGCYATNFIDFEVNPLPTPEILGAASGCGDSTLLSVDSSYVTYNWSNGIADSTQWVSSGSFTVTVTDTNGCVGTSPSALVALNPYPDAMGYPIPPSGTIFQNDTLIYTDSSTIASGAIVAWEWILGDGDTSYLENPVHIYTEPGTYTVTLTVTSAAGCTDTYTFTYEVLPLDVFIPNVFSPGLSSGANDVFEVRNLQYYNNSLLQVFDRWGLMVYESSDYKNNWDGAHYKNGKRVSSGVYYYVLKLENGKIYNGTVTIFAQ